MSCAAHRLVFLNGAFCAESSQLEGLPEGFLKTCANGVHEIALDRETCLALMPVEIAFVTTDDKPVATEAIRLRISLGKSGRLTLIEKHEMQGASAKPAPVETEILLAEQSKLVHGKIVLGKTSRPVSHLKADIAAGAFFDHFVLIAGGRDFLCDARVQLNGELAEARLLGAMLLRDQDSGTMLSCVHHHAPLGTSRQICKAVLDDKAKGAFDGHIHVAPNAQKTDGYQLCRALLLSDQAEMKAKPELEIYADDVKCSHGTAIGDLDESAMFYLRSRGIDEKQARAMLVRAFVDELVDQCQSGEIADCVRKEVATWLG